MTKRIHSSFYPASSGLSISELGIVFGEKAIFDKAETEFKKAPSISENDSESLSTMGYAYAVAGRLDDARENLGRLRQLARDSYVSPYSFARLHICVTETDHSNGWRRLIRKGAGF